MGISQLIGRETLSIVVLNVRLPTVSPIDIPLVVQRRGNTLENGFTHLTTIALAPRSVHHWLSSQQNPYLSEVEAGSHSSQVLVLGSSEAAEG